MSHFFLFTENTLYLNVFFLKTGCVHILFAHTPLTQTFGHQMDSLSLQQEENMLKFNHNYIL